MRSSIEAVAAPQCRPMTSICGVADGVSPGVGIAVGIAVGVGVGLTVSAILGGSATGVGVAVVTVMALHSLKPSSSLPPQAAAAMRQSATMISRTMTPS